MSNTAIVAGVGPTIGEAVARKLHGAGYNVGLFARSTEFIDNLADDLGSRALAVTTDLTDTTAVRDGVDAVREAFGEIEVLVLNATGGAGRPIEQASVDRLQSLFDVRVSGSLACIRALREDLEATSGTVIFSGTTFADGNSPEQIEWGAVAPAARGLSLSVADALTEVQVTYVQIGTQVLPAESGADSALTADEVANSYLDLIERENAVVREYDLYKRG